MTPRFSFSLLLRSLSPLAVAFSPLSLDLSFSRRPSRSLPSSLLARTFVPPFRSPRPSLVLFCVLFRVDVVGAKRDAIQSLSRSPISSRTPGSDFHPRERHFYALFFLFLRLSARVFLSHAREVRYAARRAPYLTRVSNVCLACFARPLSRQSVS